MSDRPPNRHAAKTGSLAFALVFAALLGGGGGAVIAEGLWGQAAGFPGALTGALALIAIETQIEVRRRRSEPRPTWGQLPPDLFLGGILGWLLGLLVPGANSLAYGLILGLINGILGMGVNKLILGTLTGLILGQAGQWLAPDLPAAALGAVILPISRILRWMLLREQEPVTYIGEQIPKEQARYVVPFEANSKYVGIDYVRNLARATDGSFKRNPPGIGLIDDLEVLRGPHFDPDQVDPRIRDFYEHTSRYRLAISPRWDLRYKPLFWAFKRTLAQPIGQANLPFNTEETQRGVISYIDTIDFNCDDIIDLRGWIRAYEDSQEAIYVGIYTTIRHEGAGYVSVGFPLPGANFTATLLPYNHQGSHFLLKTQGTGSDFPGHYLTTVDKETSALTVMKLPTFGEEIEVYVQDGHLCTDHRFTLRRLKFLTLHYTIEPYDAAT